jgi:hypothetical protein
VSEGFTRQQGIEAAMKSKQLVLCALGAAALAQPNAASARYFGRLSYGHIPEASYQTRVSFGPYPEFRSTEMRILERIRSGAKEKRLEPAAAAALMTQLQKIQARELEAHRAYGAALPDAQRLEIGSGLQQLDKLLEGGGDTP